MKSKNIKTGQYELNNMAMLCICGHKSCFHRRGGTAQYEVGANADNCERFIPKNKCEMCGQTGDIAWEHRVFCYFGANDSQKVIGFIKTILIQERNKK